MAKRRFGNPGPRILSPEWSRSRQLAGVSMPAGFLFTQLLTQSDDQGRSLADPINVKAACFPLRNDATPRKVGKWLRELHDAELIQLYEADGVPLVQIPSWWDHQDGIKRAYPSRFPPPDGWDDDVRGTGTERGRSAQGRPDRSDHGSDPSTSTRTRTDTRTDGPTDEGTAPGESEPDADGLPFAEHLVATLHRTKTDVSAAPNATSARGFGQLYRRLVRNGASELEADQRIRSAIDGVFANQEPDASGFCWADNLRSGKAWAMKTRAGDEWRFDRIERDLARRANGSTNGGRRASPQDRTQAALAAFVNRVEGMTIG